MTPAGTSIDVQNEWEENTHTHTHRIRNRFNAAAARMINRAPGMKIVLNALFAAIPDVLNVTAVCFIFFLIFAILGVNYFKGKLMSCQGDGFDALPAAVVWFIEEPVAWAAMSEEQQSWFGPLSNVSAAFAVDADTGAYTTAADCATINPTWPDYSACCSAWPTSPGDIPTSLEVLL